MSHLSGEMWARGFVETGWMTTESSLINWVIYGRVRGDAAHLSNRRNRLVIFTGERDKTRRQKWYGDPVLTIRSSKIQKREVCISATAFMIAPKNRTAMTIVSSWTKDH